MPYDRRYFLTFCWMTIALPAMGQSRHQPIPPRAQPPVMSPQDLQGVFFEDAFAHLHGARPTHLDAHVTSADVVGGMDESSRPVDTGSVGAWSAVIDRSVIEDEVKRIDAQLATSVSTPSNFKGGAYRAAWQQLNELSFLFGVIARYDADVRWKRSSQAAAHVFSVAARETRVGTQQSFDVARSAREALRELILGGGVTANPPVDTEGWDDLVDRGSLMTRLERALDKTISPGTANEGEFRKQQESLFHESQLVRAIAHVFSHHQMPDGDDEDYAAYCQQMMDAAETVVRATERQQYEAARAATGKIQQACSACHEDYRG